MTIKKTASVPVIETTEIDPFETPIHVEGIQVSDLGLTQPVSTPEAAKPSTEAAKPSTAAHGIGKLFGFAVIQAPLHDAIAFHMDGMVLGNGEKATCGIGGLNAGDYGKAYDYLKSLKNLLEIADRKTGKAKGVLSVVNTLLKEGLNTPSLVRAYDYFATRGGSEFPLSYTDEFLDACEAVQETLSDEAICDMVSSRDNFELVFAPIAGKLQRDTDARREWARKQN